MYSYKNLSNTDTNEAEEKFSEVSIFQGLKCMQEWYILWGGKRCPSVQQCLIEGVPL